MTFTTTYKTEIVAPQSLLVPDPVKGQNPVTKTYLEATVGTSIQDQLDDILAAVDVVLVGDLVSETTATVPPVVITEGNYTRVFVDQYGLVRTGTNLTFTSGTIQGTLNGASVILDLLPTGVTPGTYGNNISIPVVTVSADGRITSVTTDNVLVDSDFVISADTGTTVFSLNQTLSILGTNNQIRTTISSSTVTLSLSEDVLVFPGILSASAITANTVTSSGGFVGGLVGNVTGNVTGNLLGNIIGNVTATYGSFSSFSSTGQTELGSVAEIINLKTGAFGSVIHDFATGAIWYHTGVTGNFTVNLINVPTTNNRATGVTFIIEQGINGFIPNALTINGTAVSIRWVAGSTPVGTALKTEMVSFSMQRVNNGWLVTGSLASFG